MPTMESVDLIASGYEWICPNCDNLNKEIEIPKYQTPPRDEVMCDKCYNMFKINDVQHACG